MAATSRAYAANSAGAQSKRAARWAALFSPAIMTRIKTAPNHERGNPQHETRMSLNIESSLHGEMSDTAFIA
jgi:hypothetical protein